jgi:hypothetical protein
MPFALYGKKARWSGGDMSCKGEVEWQYLLGI